MFFAKLFCFIIMFSLIISKKNCDDVCLRICNMIYDNYVYTGLCQSKILCRCYVFNNNKTIIETFDLINIYQRIKEP